MPRAISFSLSFPTVEQARRFVDRILQRGVPSLRYEAVVHTVAADGDEMRDLLDVARKLGSRDL